MNKTELYSVICIIVCSIIALSTISYFLGTQDENVNLVPASEYINQANFIAKEWNNSSKCVVIIGAETDNTGLATIWRYSFVTSYSNGSTSDGLDVIFYSKGNYSVNERSPPSQVPITNWTIDSNEAVDIALTNNSIAQYLLKYSKASINKISFIGDLNVTDGCIVSIEWTDQGFIDNPHNARIWIDATSGKVIQVECDE